MNQPRPPESPQKNNTLKVVLLTMVGIFVLGAGSCAACGLLVTSKAKSMVSGLADGGAMLVSPPAVISELAGPKKGYVGSWTAADGSTLEISAAGQFSLQKRGGGNNSNISAPIAAFAGDNIVVNLFVTLTYRVSKSPGATGTEMVLDGITFTKTP
ncbi:MAG: hypothetical protein KBF88_12785 [Polyangiaceae bacterium]|nr:hypothetical protein [Polyangiaceae bacterium]